MSVGFGLIINNSMGFGMVKVDACGGLEILYLAGTEFGESDLSWATRC